MNRDQVYQVRTALVNSSDFLQLGGEVGPADKELTRRGFLKESTGLERHIDSFVR